MELEEITIHELNRIGNRLEEDLLLLGEKLPKDKVDKQLIQFMQLYSSKISKFNELVKESNSYLPDHIVKYYKDKDTMELSYRAIKKQPIGYIR